MRPAASTASCWPTVFLLGVLFAVLPGLMVHWQVWSSMIGFPALLFALWLLFRRLF
jgi:hypothetical protein